MFFALLALLRGIYRWPVNSSHKGQWRGAMMTSLICARTNGWVDNRDADDLRRHGADYNVTVIGMNISSWIYWIIMLQNYCTWIAAPLCVVNIVCVFIHIHQGCFAGTGAIVRLPQCQWSKPDGYGKISQCITTTKHSKAKTVCIFLGIYCSHQFPVPSPIWNKRHIYWNNPDDILNITFTQSPQNH